jgi:hypothetical protein
MPSAVALLKAAHRGHELAGIGAFVSRVCRVVRCGRGRNTLQISGQRQALLENPDA